MAMDNMQIRKAQLKKLDDFVKTLYEETQTFKQYGIDLKDLEILYLHIHDLIEELLQCDTTEEFMKMIEQLHKAVAGVLIMVVPQGAEDVMKDFMAAHDGADAGEMESFINNLKGRSTSTKAKEDDDVENDPDELVDILDLSKHVKKKTSNEDDFKLPSKEKKEDNPSSDSKQQDTDSDDDDPLSSLWTKQDNN